jgi:hypothetical protein
MVDNAYIRPQVSGAGIRSVAVATITGYHDLSEFEHGVISQRTRDGTQHLQGSDAFSHKTIS